MTSRKCPVCYYGNLEDLGHGYVCLNCGDYIAKGNMPK